MRRYLAPVLAWTPVVVLELVAVPNYAWFGYLVPLGELAIAAVAVAVSARWTRKRHPGVRWRWIAAVAAGLGVAVWCTNWSVLHPQSYFALHRPQFGYVAAHPPTSTSYYGERLPWWTADISTDGNASLEGHQTVLIPQWFGLLDGAVGYVHAPAGSPPTTYLDMKADPISLADCDPLWDDWYWCPGDR